MDKGSFCMRDTKGTTLYRETTTNCHELGNCQELGVGGKEAASRLIEVGIPLR